MTPERSEMKEPLPMPPGLPRLYTVKNTAAVLAPTTAKTEPAIWADVFKSQDRFNSRGEKICGNGLAATGAIIRRGRKVLIDIDLYMAWLSGRESEKAG